MTKERSESKTQAPEGRPRGLSGIQKILLVVSLLLTAGGVVLMLTTGVGGDPEPVAPGGNVDPALLAQGFAPTGDNGASAESAPEGGFDPWGPTIFRLGFSFFVAFAIGFAVRSFLKISILAIGVILLGLFGLQSADVIDVDWAQLEGFYDRAMPWLKDQTATFTAFIQGYLPSAASVGAGLFYGLRRG
jgi:uncharacterized membrane protein (Fun14 family)